MSDGRRFLLVVHAEGEGPPVPIRLRRFIKRLLRGYGVRLESIEEIPTGQNKSSLASIEEDAEFDPDRAKEPPT